MTPRHGRACLQGGLNDRCIGLIQERVEKAPHLNVKIQINSEIIPIIPIEGVQILPIEAEGTG